MKFKPIITDDLKELIELCDTFSKWRAKDKRLAFELMKRYNEDERRR